jgi:hypothetical protein
MAGGAPGPQTAQVVVGDGGGCHSCELGGRLGVTRYISQRWPTRCPSGPTQLPSTHCGVQAHTHFTAPPRHTHACNRTTSRYGAPPKTHQGYATVKYTWASEAKAHKLADRNGVTAWGPCNGVCMGGYCKLDEPTDMSACCVPAAGP